MLGGRKDCKGILAIHQVWYINPGAPLCPNEQFEGNKLDLTRRNIDKAPPGTFVLDLDIFIICFRKDSLIRQSIEPNLKLIVQYPFPAPHLSSVLQAR